LYPGLCAGAGGRTERIRQLVDGLPSPLPVHYDPRDPARSYLLVNPMGSIHVLSVFGVGAMLLGLLQLLL
jgi:hypothetical protein